MTIPPPSMSTFSIGAHCSGGMGFIQTSSYLLPRQLFDKVRFDVESPHDDWEFLLRLSKQVGARIETVPEVLVVLYFEEQRPSLTKRTSSWFAFSQMARQHRTDHHAACL